MRTRHPSTGRVPALVLPGWWWRGGEAVGYGRLLGLGSLLATALALVVLYPTPVHGAQLAGVAAFHLVAVWLSFVLPWGRWSPWALLAFPLLSLAGLVIATDAAPGLGGVLAGFFVLCFAYAGLFLPPRGGWALLLPAVTAYMATATAMTSQLYVRTAFVALAWLTLAELLGRLQRRHDALVAQLQADNLVDPLTGLANRRGQARFLTEAAPGDVLIVIDLDHFKQVNDEQGHAVGDHVLAGFGRLLLQQLRTRDRAARSGGEEMLVLLRCAEEDRCGEELVRRLRRSVAEADLGITFSAGLAVVRPGQTVEQVLADADRATYCAKHAGRDQAWLAGDPHNGFPDTPVQWEAALAVR
ncbi:GGDEF domain-containing protein [Modestobacter versicolor]|uniref:Diguanylate cyclase (GGDEF)-like protein n=1 Tax=Modestobacter versicolor TaxID=429133 RepID=A0A839Y4A8_9ACTN|nr:GGDEF domain-containing protein [Modestobacter versicolor]MBB3676202.1 diguanylate cyclase (GGDEF)-like protein [Modestobacter versicolor]